jgi:hypothetical protein
MVNVAAFANVFTRVGGTFAVISVGTDPERG